MSQPLSNVTAGNTAGALWFSVNGNGAALQGAGLNFKQALGSMLSGNAKPIEGDQLSQALSLPTFLTADGNLSAEEQQTEALRQLVESLLQGIDGLDQAVMEDLSLFAYLQSWLQTVHVGLGTQPQQDQVLSQLPLEHVPSTNQNDRNEISNLASHPETVRFAVQDTLVQLLSSLNQGKKAGIDQQYDQVRTAVESLQSLLVNTNANSLEGNRNAMGKSNNEQSINGSWAAVMNNRSDNASASSLNAHVPLDGAQGDRLVMQVNVNADASKNQTAASNLASRTTMVEESDLNQLGLEFTIEGESSLQSGGTITAGQLALRDMGNAAVKLSVPTVPVENFSKDMGDFLVGKFDIIKLHGVSEARISLYPEHLGQVDVKITMQNGQMVAQFITEHGFAKDSLEQQMSQLRAALQSQGIQVSKLEVTQSADLSSQMYHNDRQQGNDGGGRQNTKRREVSDEDALVVGNLNEEWNEWLSEVRAGENHYESSFVARV